MVFDTCLAIQYYSDWIIWQNDLPANLGIQPMIGAAHVVHDLTNHYLSGSSLFTLSKISFHESSHLVNYVQARTESCQIINTWIENGRQMGECLWCPLKCHQNLNSPCHHPNRLSIYECHQPISESTRQPQVKPFMQRTACKPNMVNRVNTIISHSTLQDSPLILQDSKVHSTYLRMDSNHFNQQISSMILLHWREVLALVKMWGAEKSMNKPQ